MTSLGPYTCQRCLQGTDNEDDICDECQAESKADFRRGLVDVILARPLDPKQAKIEYERAQRNAKEALKRILADLDVPKA